MFSETELNKLGIQIILMTQTLPLIVGPQTEMFWTIYMKMADPNLIYFLYTPILYPFFTKTMRQVMITATLSEFISGILKRVFMTHRPYWWIYESGIYTNQTMPKLQQFRLTCESTPGNSSVHMVVIASVWFVFVQRLKRYGSTIHTLSWSFYVTTIFAFSFIRIYAANQFPHWTVIGLLIGISVGLFVMHFVSRPDSSLCGYLTAACATISLLTVSLSYLFTWNLDWSDRLALKWCEKPIWMTVSPTPFEFMFRDIAYLAGLTCAFYSLKEYHTHDMFPLWKQITFILCNVSICALTVFLSKKVEHLGFYYVYLSMQHFCLAYVIVFVIPCFVGGYQPIQYEHLDHFE